MDLIRGSFAGCYNIKIFHFIAQLVLEASTKLYPKLELILAVPRQKSARGRGE